MNRDQVINYCSEVSGKPFIWGHLDCSLFPAHCLDALLGTSYSANWVGRWSDEDSARAVSDETGQTLESWLVHHGCERVDHKLVGDFLMINTGDWLTAGVYVGRSRMCLCEPTKGVRLVHDQTVPHRHILGVR